MAGSIRPAAAAGTFYPADPRVLAATVDGLLDEAAPPSDVGRPRALVVPHAGYQYSGPIAATAYALLRSLGSVAGPVAILGPAHFVPLAGVAVPAADAWDTPLGLVEVDRRLRAAAARAGAVADDLPHRREHAIEVQLPFVRRTLGDVAVLPVAVGMSVAAEVGAVVDALEDAGAGLIVVSSDLSHYHDQATARGLDARTAEAVVRADPDGVGTEDACGVFALRGLLDHVRRHGRTVRLLDLRTSADVAGHPEQVVGYGAFVVV